MTWINLDDGDTAVSETSILNSTLLEMILVQSCTIFNFYIIGPSDTRCDILDPGNT
jgi:hypothetical protein